MSERQPWERQPTDTPKSWAAFCIYRDLGEGRSIDKAYRHQNSAKSSPKSKEAPRWWSDWSTKCSWVARTSAYDSYLDDQERAQYEKDKLQAREERHLLIKAAKSKIPLMLESLTEEDVDAQKLISKLKPTEVINFIRLVLQEERAEFNDEPTQRHEHSGSAGAAIPVDIIDHALRKVYGEQGKEEGEGEQSGG